MRQFSLTRVQECTQPPFENEYTRIIASLFFRAQAKGNKALRWSATVRKSRVFCAQLAFDKNNCYDCLDWHTNSSPVPKQLHCLECNNFILNLAGTNSA